MKIKFIAISILSGALAVSSFASPINFSQISDPQSGRQTKGSTATQPSNGSSEAVNANLTVESLEHPEFVRLADGRMIPYGPGVVCSDACVDSVVEAQGFPRKWLIAVPLAGAAIAGVILAMDSPRIPRTTVDGVNQPPTTNPTPNPTPTPGCMGDNCGNPPVQPVPEPATLALMGAGLAVMSRRRVKAFLKREKK